MSRSRSRQIDAPFAKFHSLKLHYTNPQTYGYHSGLNYDSGKGVRYDRMLYETMTDEFPFTQAGRPFRSVDHYKIRYARLDGTQFNLGPVGTYPMSEYIGTTFWAGPYSAMSCTEAMSSALASLDWNSYVIALSNLVESNITSKSQIAVSLMELSKTIQMVRNPFGLLKHNWRQIAGKHSAASLAKRNANIWLEQQYGWKSTYYDIRNTSEAAAKYLVSYQSLVTRREYRRLSKAGRPTFAAPSPTVSDTDWNAWRTGLDGTMYGAISPFSRIVFLPGTASMRFGCWARDPSNGPLHTINQAFHAFGLSSDQILTSMWELVPYSFVIDWFVNMKALMQIPELAHAHRTLSSALLTRMGYSVKLEIPFEYQIFHCQYQGNNWPSNWHATMQNRSPNHWTTGRGSVSRYIRTPGIPSGFGSVFTNKGLSVQQGISGLSMLIQRIVRR